MDLRQLLGIKYPIIQGAMANITDGRFCAAVSNAGGLGIIAAGGMDTGTLRENIITARSLTDKPFGVNIMLMHPQADEMAELLIEMKTEVVTTGAGNPEKYISGWKKAGIKILPVVPSVSLALRMEKYGADAVIFEGTESGGHVGELTTMAVLPQVCRALNIPVAAAGGIASGEQFLAALVLGACGVQIGTVLLASEECPVHENYKQAVLSAKDSDTVVTGRIGGVPVRVLKNRMSREYVRREKEGAGKEELESYTLGSLRRAVFDGDTATGSVMLGQTGGLVSEIKPVAQILEDLYEDAAERLAGFCAEDFFSEAGK